MSSIKDQIKKRPVLTFFLLAYAITWSIWTPISYCYVHNTIELTPTIITIYILGGFGPFLAATIVTKLTDRSLRAWFAQALKWRVPVKWWLAAFFFPTLLYALMAGIHLLMGGKLKLIELSSLLSLPGGFLSVFLWGRGNEELGWRGLALPRLQDRYNPLVSSLIVGVIWTFWHAPPGVIELGFVDWVTDLPFYMTTVTGISVVAAWLYNKSGGSVLLTMIFHASVNVMQTLYPVQEMFSRTGEVARTIAWILLALSLIFNSRAGFFYKGKKIYSCVCVLAEF